ncbi:MAG: hypothetical protein RMZ69_21900, partial [Nostoc sp. ChiQUE01a]|nr:hypothetical protein [Nostoc sp. ChiQUE01a]
RLLAEVGKRVRGKGERANKNPFPFNLFPFPPLAKVTFARGIVYILHKSKIKNPTRHLKTANAPLPASLRCTHKSSRVAPQTFDPPNPPFQEGKNLSKSSFLRRIMTDL